MKRSLEERLQRVPELRKAGYNCSQCVFMVFDDIHGLTDEQAARVSAALGSGVGGQREVCGSVCAMSMVIGMRDFNSPADKVAVYAKVKEAGQCFSEKNGSIVCRELTADSTRRKPCVEYIKDSITIAHESLGE